jgi:hypothetical protein
MGLGAHLLHQLTDTLVIHKIGEDLSQSIFMKRLSSSLLTLVIEDTLINNFRTSSVSVTGLASVY